MVVVRLDSNVRHQQPMEQIAALVVKTAVRAYSRYRSVIASPLEIWIGVAGPDLLQAWCGGIELYLSPRRACARSPDQ